MLGCCSCLQNFSSQAAFVLMLTVSVSMLLCTALDSRQHLVLIIKPCLFNLATVCVKVTGGHDSSLMNPSHFVFSSCSLPITQEPLGEQELLVNQPLMWEPQSPRQQNCFSLILHVFELRNQSPWTCLRREPGCLPAADEKADQGGIKGEMYATSFHITRPLRSPGCTIWRQRSQKAATNKDSRFAAVSLIYSVQCVKWL